jgi:serine/threonine protein kinase
MISETISHYRIIKKLGEGGMGVVYLAEDITLGRQVTMKVLSTPTKEYRAKFLQEARTISALIHPNIPSVFECGETVEGQPYIVMEFVKGHSLENKLHEGALPLLEAIKIVSGIAEALGEIHRRGIVHRDVKPSNVLITDRGHVKLIDFGISKLVSEQIDAVRVRKPKAFLATRTHSDLFTGTARYASPEQVTGNVSGRSDLFALGVVLYECLTGKLPFSGASSMEIRNQILHFTPLVPSKINAQVPLALDRITMKAIEKRIEDRYQTADQVIEALRSVPATLDYDSVGWAANLAPGRLLPKVNSQSLQDFEAEFDDLVTRMQKPKSKRAVKVAFSSSPAQLGRGAVKHARKKR